MRLIGKYTALILLLLIPSGIWGQALVNVKPGGKITVKEGTTVKIDGGLKIDNDDGTNGDGEIELEGTGADTTRLYLTGDFILDGLFTESGGFLWYTGTANPVISSSIFDYIYLENLFIEKSAGRIILNEDLYINNKIYFLNGILDVYRFDFVLSETASIFANLAEDNDRNLFDEDNCIYFSQPRDYATPANDAGKVVVNVPDNSTDYVIFLPLGSTDETYSTSVVNYDASQIELTNENGTDITYGDSAYVALTITPEEHPGVELPNLSLKKYWTVETSDITLNARAADVDFKYDQDDVPSGGNEGQYEVLLYSDAWDDPTGYWRINPGEANDVVEFNQNRFYTTKVDLLDGDWTAGDESAAQAEYYSRQDGDYDDPNTWSNDAFGGPPASSAPSKRSDKIYIGQAGGAGHTVTVNDAVDPVGLLEVQELGTLIINGEYAFEGDTFNLEAGGHFKTAHSEGFTDTEGLMASDGCVKTDVRIYSEDAFYYYIGSEDYGGTPGAGQRTGDGMPNSVQSLTIDKDAGALLTLEKSVLIKDSLSIIDGFFDIATYTVNGQGAARTLNMYAGELRVNSFPENYSPPTFTAGTVHFKGTGNAVIPSETSAPGVLQYNDLKISGDRDGIITFKSGGEVKISGNFDLTELTFNPIKPDRYNTNGATINFNGADQNVPYISSTYTVDELKLKYNNIKFEGSGVKTITNVPGLVFEVFKNITINGVTLNPFGCDIQVKGNWISTGGTFIPGNTSVTMLSPTSTLYTYIDLDIAADNEFFNLNIAGNGIVSTDDDLTINGDLTIDNSNLELDANEVTIFGNWTNIDGSFTHGDSKIIFSGNATHTLSNNSGNEFFYDLEINEKSPTELGLVEARDFPVLTDNGIRVENDLTLNRGVLRTEDTWVIVDGNIVRNTGGHIWGGLRKNIPVDAYNVTYELGSETEYTPIELNFEGTGGLAGYLEIASDTISAEPTDPIYLNGSDEIEPVDNYMSNEKTVLRQWKMSIPSGGTFEVGNNRTYDAIATFINTGDLRNGADPNYFETRIYTESGTWIEPDRNGDPNMGTLTATTTEMVNISEIGSLIIGEPFPPSYFSIADGIWKNADNWSTQGYGGPAASTYPPENARVFIGDGKRIEIINDSDPDAPAIGVVTVDSSGTLAFDRNATLGDQTGGEFRLLAHGTVEIGHRNGTGTNGARNNGNVQTDIVDFNFGGHNQSNFIFDRDNSGAGQEIRVGYGIPDTVKTVVVNCDEDVPPDGIQLFKDLTVSDSLAIIDGTLIAGNFDEEVAGAWAYHDISLLGNMAVQADGDFDAGEAAVTFEGNGQDSIRNDKTTPIDFYDFIVNKIDSTGDVVLTENTGITILNSLEFESTNESQIVARNSGSYVRIDENAPGGWLIGAGAGGDDNDIGWIDGELQRWVPAGTIGTGSLVLFPVGNEENFTPMSLGFSDGGGTAGYVGSNVIEEFHPELDDFTVLAPPDGYGCIDPNRTAFRYWQLLLPNGSSFDQDSRRPIIQLYLSNPEDFANADDHRCMDMAMWDGTKDTANPAPPFGGWTHFRNSSTGPYCSDTRTGTGDFNYSYGDDYSDECLWTRTTVDNSGNYDFGTSYVVDDAVLLGDFVIGNTNEKINFRRFYSIKSGDWNDPSCWSTENHSSVVNEGSTINNDLDGQVFYPATQYDHAYIGHGDTIKLKGSSGHIAWGWGREPKGKMGPNTIVESDGTLDLSEGILAGHAFEIKKGGTLILGSEYGIDNDGGSVGGNIYCSYKTYADSINITFKPTGKTPDPREIINSNCMMYPWSVAGGSRYIERSVIYSGTTELMNCFTGNTLIDQLAFMEYAAELEAGQTYDIEVTKNNSSNDRFSLWLDYNYNASFDGSEELISGDRFNNNQTETFSFTVPANTPPGLTFIRVLVRENGGGGIRGEYEMYGAIIKNDDWGDITQAYGDGMPDILESMTVHSEYGDATNTATVQSGKDLTVTGDVSILAGDFDISGDSLKIKGDLRIDTTDAIIPNNGVVYFYGQTASDIYSESGTGTAAFDYLSVNKGIAGILADSLNIKTDIRVNEQLAVKSETPVFLDDNITVTLGVGAFISGENGGIAFDDFSKYRMLIVSGDETGGIIKKEYSTTSSDKDSLFIPVGLAGATRDDNVLNAADLALVPETTFSGDPYIELVLRDEIHPDLTIPDGYSSIQALKKYWSISANDIDPTDLSARYFDFHYIPEDTVGKADDYLPALFSNSTWWEVNLGDYDKVSGAPSPFYAHAEVADQLTFIDGDWTAAVPDAVFEGRVFFARQNGDWSDPETWTNDTTYNYPASYYPGERFAHDKVYIDCNSVIYDVTESTTVIDTLSIACIKTCDSGLRFGDNVGTVMVDKHLRVDSLLKVCESGYVDRVNINTNNNRDTLTISGILENNSDGLGGHEITQINETNPSPDYTVLQFSGGISDGDNTVVNGEGAWTGFADIIMSKTNTNGLQGKLIINSESFADQTALPAETELKFILERGVLSQNGTTDLYLSGSDDAVVMGIYSGIEVTAGTIYTRGDLITEANSVITVDGGDLNIGNGINDHLMYQSGTTIDVLNGNLNITGTFSRYIPSSEVDLTVSGGSVMNVMSSGSDEAEKTGFDLYNAGSMFTLDNAEIHIHYPTGSDSPDMTLGASKAGTEITGGSTVYVGQTGTTYTAPDNVFEIESDIAFENLIIAGINNNTSQNSDNLTVNVEIEIEDNSSYSINGNTFNLAGNLTNFGEFIAVPGEATGLPWQFNLIGSNNQVIYHDDAYTSDFTGLEFHNLRLDKEEVSPGVPSTVTLGRNTGSDEGYSGITIRNNFEFSAANQSYIDTKAFDDADGNPLFVHLEKDGFGSAPVVVRNGDGHVYGTVYRVIENENVAYSFPVGSDIVSGYYPAVFKVIGTFVSGGVLGAEYFTGEHPNFDNSVTDEDTDLPMYWNIEKPTGSSLDLGASANFELTTRFFKSDIPAATNITLAEHFVYSDDAGSFDWYNTSTVEADSVLVKSEDNTYFGDYIVGEPAAVHYYSIAADGPWNDPNSWSLVGYDGAAAPDYPRTVYDVAHIGDDCKITIPDNSDYEIQSAIVENIGDGPGKLHILGYENILYGKSFDLQDSTTLAVQHWGGVDACIQFDVENFGIANYIFNLGTGAQITGDDMPGEILSLYVDNQTVDTTNKYLAINEDVTGNYLTIHDSISVINGRLQPFKRKMRLYGNVNLDNGGYVRNAQERWDFAATAPRSNNVILKGDTTLILEDVEISGDGLNFDVSGSTDIDDDDLAKILHITDTSIPAKTGAQITFSGDGLINVRDIDAAVLYESENAISRTGTGYVNGKLSMPFSAVDDTKRYITGTAAKYLPMTVETDNLPGGSAGFITGISYDVVPEEPNYGNRLDVDKRVEDYWELTTDTNFVFGSRRINLTVDFPAADEDAGHERPTSVFRRLTHDDPKIPYQRFGAEITFSDDTPEAGRTQATLSIPAEKWLGDGEFYLGNMAVRTFYSCGTGDWDDHTVWAFDETCTDPAPAGIFPNQDWDSPNELEIGDRVIIQNSDNITLTTQPELTYLEIGDTGTLTVPDGNFIEPSALDVEGFVIADEGGMNIGTTYGLESGSTGLVRFDPADRTISPNSKFEFSGAGSQDFGDAFPDEIGTLTVSNTSATDILSLPTYDLTINDLLSVTDGELRPAADNSTLAVNGDISVSGTGVLDMTQDTGGTPLNTNLDFTGNADQTISGGGALTFDDILVGKTGGDLNIESDIDVAGVFDLDGPIPNAVNTSAVVTFTTCEAGAIIGYDAGSFFNLDTDAGGRLNRLICPDGDDYLFPIGSGGVYAPVNFASEAAGTEGYMAISTQTGGSAATIGAHAGVNSGTTDWLERIWTVDDNMTAQINGELTFNYDDSEISGTESNIDALGRWRPQYEGTVGGYWDFWNDPDALFDNGANTVQTSTAFDWTDITGDWALANEEAFKRIFYSLKDGDWDDPATWTMNDTHTGMQFGDWPSSEKDSVVIGLGHTVDLTADAVISGIDVGNPSVSPPEGTLNTAGFYIGGDVFKLNENSTLIVTSPDGITALGQADQENGSVRADDLRNYGSPAALTNLVYRYSADQVTGSGLPTELASLTVENTGAIGEAQTPATRDNELTFGSSVLLHGNFTISSGSVLLGNYTATAEPTATADFTLGSGAVVSIGAGTGTNNMVDALDNYDNYTLADDSFVEFAGGNQSIAILPASIDPVVIGLPNLILLNPGTKTINQAITIRGNLFNKNGSVLNNSIGINAVEVKGSVINESEILNEGTIEIGE